MGLSAVFDVTYPNSLRAEHTLYSRGNEEILMEIRSLFGKYKINFKEKKVYGIEIEPLPRVEVVTDKGSKLGSALWEISGIRGGGQKALFETTHYFYFYGDGEQRLKKLESWLKHYTKKISKSKS